LEEVTLKRARIVMVVLMLFFATGGFAQVRLEAYLWDASYQSGQQWGEATLLVDGTRVEYEIILSFAENISSAVITRSNGVPIINLHASSGTNVATGLVSVEAPLASTLTADPTSLFLRIGSLGGDLIGALRYADVSSSGPTAAFLPLVAHNSGRAGSNWRTDLHLTSLAGGDVEVTLDYFPVSAEDSAVPAATRTVTVGGSGQLVLRDVLGVLFGRDNERGAMRLSAATAFGARVRLYDVAPDEGAALAGAISLYSRALELSDIPTGGAPLASNRTGVSGDGFRTNVIVFNPTEVNVTVTLTAHLDDGSLVGSRTLTVGPYANDVTPVFDLIQIAAPGGLEQGSFLLKYFASGPLIVQAAEIDGATGDGVLVDPVAISSGAWDYLHLP
jgi:hypothetical protein